MKLKINKRLINLLILGGIVTINGCCEYEQIKDFHESEEKEEKEIKVSEIEIPFSEPTIIETERLASDRVNVSVNEMVSNNSVSKNIVSENEAEETFEWDTYKYTVFVKTLKATKLYSGMEEDVEVLKTLEKNDTFVKTDYYYDGFYEVEYDGNVAYIPRSDSEVLVRPVFEHGFTKVVKINKGSTIYIDPTLKTNFTTYDDNFEIAEVYQEHDGVYLVRTIDYVGYVDKNDTEDITEDMFIVVDKSSQNMIVYKDNERKIDTPVTTGAPGVDTETPIGEYSIWCTNFNRYLSGVGYSVHVDAFWGFKGGYGIHDAYWMSEESFGKIEPESHGCVRTPTNEVHEMMKMGVGDGTKVYVKQ